MPDAHTDSPIPIPSNIQAQPSLHQSHPSTTPINLLYYNNNSFTGSTIIQQRQKNNTDCKLTAPSRVFKVLSISHIVIHACYCFTCCCLYMHVVVVVIHVVVVVVIRVVVVIHVVVVVIRVVVVVIGCISW